MKYRPKPLISIKARADDPNLAIANLTLIIFVKFHHYIPGHKISSDTILIVKKGYLSYGHKDRPVSGDGGNREYTAGFGLFSDIRQHQSKNLSHIIYINGTVWRP